MQVLITITRGIIADAVFFENPQLALQALSRFVKDMNPEDDDAAIYDDKGFVANAKDFLDENDDYVADERLMGEVAEDKDKPIYLIGNPSHPLGFMVASPDDPLGYIDPVEALCELGEMRQDHGMHLKLYRVIPVQGPIATRSALEQYCGENEIEECGYNLVEEYLAQA
jgi:hypothetical protein